MSVRMLIGDCLEQLAALPDESVHCCITSPPYYGLRCYGVDGQIGLEPTPDEHIAKLVEVFREVRRVLRKDGVLWLNYGDAYATTVNGRSAADTKAAGNDDRTFRDKPYSTVGNGYKAKDLLMMPARVALALQQDGWWLRSMMPWVKRSAMPESVTDRPATAIEYVFLLAKSPRYYFDMEAVRSAANVATQRSAPARNVTEAIGNTGGNKRSDFEKNRHTVTSRNFRNSDLFYASLEPPHGLICGDDPLALDVNPAAFSESHFATFPPKLVEPLIKAATSEKGVCAECGAPWVREVDATEEYKKKLGKGMMYRYAKDGTAGRSVLTGAHANKSTKAEYRTLGWSPSCACNAAVVPATVLDPFGGAGTVGLVADRLKRNSILIELNPEYADMARRRISGDAPLFAEVSA